MTADDGSASAAPEQSMVSILDAEPITLCDVLDRVLNKGVVVVGHATISVADVDLLYLGLQVVLTSVERAEAVIDRKPAPAQLGA